MINLYKIDDFFYFNNLLDFLKIDKLNINQNIKTRF